MQQLLYNDSLDQRCWHWIEVVCKALQCIGVLFGKEVGSTGDNLRSLDVESLEGCNGIRKLVGAVGVQVVPQGLYFVLRGAFV